MGATRAYNPIMRATVVCTVFVGVIYLNVIRPDQLGTFYAFSAIFGMIMIAVLPVLLTLAVEEAYPIPSDASTSILYVMAIVAQIPLTPLIQHLITMEGP